MEEQTGKEEGIIYAPSALLHLFNNALNVGQTRRMVQIKGVYIHGKGSNYNGYYYDGLRDESSDALLTLIVPALLRPQLVANKTILFYGYITRRVVVNGGRIELQINLSDLIEQTQNRFTEDDVRRLEIQQRKSEAGYRDVQAFLKSNIVGDRSSRIDILIGKQAIIDQDIRHQLEETEAAYQIRFHRINFSSESEIIQAIESFNTEDTDLLVLARGGGEHIQLFDKPAIAERCLRLIPYLVTCIGHKDDNPLVQKIADRAFITPTAFGQFLNDLYNDTIAELQSSKAKIVEDITKTLEANYAQQVKNLNEQLAAHEQQKQQHINDLKILNEQERLQAQELSAEKVKILDETIAALREQKRTDEAAMQQLTTQLTELSKIKSVPQRVPWLYIVIAILAGLILGILLF